MGTNGWKPTLERIRRRAMSSMAHVVMTDGEDERILQAIDSLLRAAPNGKLRITLLRGPGRLDRRSLFHHNNIEICTPLTDPLTDEFADTLREMREFASKPVPSFEDAVHAMKKHELFGAMLLATGRADAMIGGAGVPSADVLRAGLQIVGTVPGRATVSGAFAMFLSRPLPGGQELVVFADCAVLPTPTSRQLADIALNSAELMQTVFQTDPIIGFLSFSTKQSAVHDSLRLIHDALKMVHEERPDLTVDGELQADTAIVPEIANRKDPYGCIHGLANVLVFPDLNAGNIAYKLVEQAAGAKAVGVILSGFAKPVNDLSRGCTAGDVADMICVTALQAASAILPE